MTQAEVMERVHSKCLSFRALDRLVQSVAFSQAYELDPNNIWVQFAIINGDSEFIENWIEKTLIKDIGEMSLRELRELAARYRIPCYTSFNKNQLLIKIAQVKNDSKIKEIAS